MDLGFIVLSRLPRRPPSSLPSAPGSGSAAEAAAGQPSLSFVLLGAHAGIFGEGKAVIAPELP